MVGPVGLEPTRLSAIVPKTILATNYSKVPRSYFTRTSLEYKSSPKSF